MSTAESPQEPDASPLEGLAAELGDPDLFPPEVVALHAAGRGLRARRALLAAAKRETSLERQARQRELAADLRLWVEPIRSAPTMFTFNGIGLRVLGSHQAGRDGWQVATQWISFVFLPLWPVAAFVARPEGGGWSFAGRTALPPRARTTRRVVAALVLLVAGAITWGAYRAGTRVEVWAYNGFGQPLEVTVGGETRTLLELSLIHI